LKTPKALAKRLSLFRSRGRLSWDVDDISSRDNWISALTGLSCMPRDYHPLVDVADPDLVDRFMGELQQAVLANVGKLPGHDACLRQLQHVK